MIRFEKKICGVKEKKFDSPLITNMRELHIQLPFMLIYDTYMQIHKTLMEEGVTVITFLIDFLRLDVGDACSGGGSSTGLSFRLLENFLRLRLSAANAPKFKCICR